MATAGPRDDGGRPTRQISPLSPWKTPARAYDRLCNLSKDVTKRAGRSLSHGERVGVRGYGLSIARIRSPWSLSPGAFVVRRKGSRPDRRPDATAMPLSRSSLWGEGVRPICEVMSFHTDKPYPLTLFPLPMGEETGCDLNVIFSSPLPWQRGRDANVASLSHSRSNRGVAKAVEPEPPSLPAQESRGQERAGAHASQAPTRVDRAPAPNQPAVV
jgi:hypothetical protein